MTNILVVDDSDVDRRLITGLLRSTPSLHVSIAENGKEALTRLNGSSFDLVLTDMQMPEMDGLELVRAISVYHPDVPVVLMTAHGSDQLAMEALAEGAASYVPKSELADKLDETISQVLALTGANRNYERLSACQTRAEFSFLLENDAALIDPLVDLMQQIAFRMGLCDANGRFRFGMAMQQALLNALYHGNLEVGPSEVQDARESLLSGKGPSLLDQRRTQAPYRDRKIFVDVRMGNDEAKIIVRDEGPGFDVKKILTPTNGSADELHGARGLRLMHAFMDEVAYNPAGNEVTMTKRRAPVAAT